MKRLALWALVLLAGCVSSGALKTEAEVIAIARDRVAPSFNPKHRYAPVARFQDGEWIVKFDSDSGFVGDSVYVHVDKFGEIKAVEGGY